jgi:hypothetical protein
MVAKIVEDENQKNLLASGNSNSLQFSFKALKSHQNAGNNHFQQFFQISPTNSFFLRQDSKSRYNLLYIKYYEKFYFRLNLIFY